mgnify:FL=1
MDDSGARVSHAVSELDRTTQQNAALVEESAAAAARLQQQARRLAAQGQRHQPHKRLRATQPCTPASVRTLTHRSR